MQFLVQWANGSFQILTGEQLRKELDEYKKSPPRLYKLVTNCNPERLYVSWAKDSWILYDIYRNHVEI